MKDVKNMDQRAAFTTIAT